MLYEEKGNIRKYILLRKILLVFLQKENELNNSQKNYNNDK